MTTQNTHSEHSDVELSVVEHAPVSETNASAPLPESAEPVDETASDAGLEENLPGGQVILVEQHSPQEDSSVEPGQAPPTPSVASSLMEEEEEVRPFTDFIEEFRQAEARFSSSLQAYQTEALSLPSLPVEDVAVESEIVPRPAGENISGEPSTLKQEAEQVQDLPLQQVPTVEAGLAPVQQTIETETGAPPRPVSPLLRPASRLRLPRHGSIRQRDEQAVEAVLAPALSPPEIPTPPPPPMEEPKVEPGAGLAATLSGGQVSLPPVEEQPRPARRYRFDRPAASTASGSAAPSLAGTSTPSTPLPSRSEDSKDAAKPPRPDNGYVVNGQTSEKEAVEAGLASALPEAVGAGLAPDLFQEAPVAESSPAPVKTSGSEQERRRRHGQDRQRGKEQPAATAAVPVANVAPVAVPSLAETPTVAEATGVQQEGTNPEDLPPLEYAEIQKATSRRRRKRHVGGSTTPAAATTPSAATAKAATPETPPVPPVSIPTPTQTPPVAIPHAPGQANQYTITSGFTVNQMNRAHDGSSPFMGPEPSPARGSAAAQHVRSIRTDAQRTPAYPVRITEATSASVHQLANVVSQAIQTQTDRMIAELRHANQTPTNISVSMPPFPSNERVGVFVDVANLLYSARTLRMTVDFGKLLDFLRGNRRLIRAHAYCPTSPQPGDEQMFLQAVKGLGYRITTKNYKTFSSGAKKADLDLDLCMDVVRLVDGKAVDCVILVSGDSDFMPMLDYCSDHGVRVEVAAFDEAMSATLRQSCDLFINLSMLDEIRV